ncbi:MAG: hypothetical protein V4543_04190 [Bacteroidota bacterium]
MLSQKHKNAWNYFKNHKFTHDDKRNIRLGAIVSLYGVSFSIEKLMSYLNRDLSDGWWFIIYGVFALLSCFWWVEDALLDIYEANDAKDNYLKAKGQNNVS